MARLNDPQKTQYKGIYTAKDRYGKTVYLARFTYQNREYSYKNLQLLHSYPNHPINSASKAYECLQWCKRELKAGRDPFLEEISSAITPSTISELVTSHWAPKSTKYAQNILSSYRKHMDKHIGNLRINDLTAAVLRQAFKLVIEQCQAENLPNHHNVTKNIKKVLRPILDYAVEDKHLEYNFLDARSIKDTLSTRGTPLKPRLETRLANNDIDGFISAAKAIYNAAKTYSRQENQGPSNNELRLAFLFAFMTGRRIPEILNLHYEDLSTRNGIVTVKVRPEITKSDIEDEYPLPIEVISRLEPQKKGKKFAIKESTFQHNFRILLNSLDVDLHRDHKLYQHDKRKLFTSIMTRRGYSRDDLDELISHAYSIKRAYNPITLDYKIKVFEEYWGLLRQ
ncbi:MAG: tyrosine-type recombinase/integrase [Campylobacterales bacterium]|nr:tyrosine-type recombinase/integrase [Campylobacterales bacterium]